jgi:hydrogenase maturation factor
MPSGMTGAGGPGGSPAELLPRAAFDLSRRLAAGGTLWCASPQWPWHSRHIAVEFVHPVIMGKRALPAVAATGPGWLDQVRSRSRPGDALLVISSPEREDTRQAMRLAPAWGVMTIWMGGPGVGGGADHGLTLEGDLEEAAFGGATVRAYHLLWELVHVCLEHPGLMTAEAVCDTDGHCITCADEGRLAEILSSTGDRASVRSPAGVEDADLTLVPDARPGDLVVLHAGLAISVVEQSSDRTAARR